MAGTKLMWLVKTPAPSELCHRLLSRSGHSFGAIRALLVDIILVIYVAALQAAIVFNLDLK